MWDLSMAEQWKYYKPPIRPSKADLEIFGKYLKEKIAEKGKNIKILILGSTPELRSLVHTFGLSLLVCDYIEDNYRELGKLVEYQGKEIPVHQDWTTMEIGEQFDFIFAEASPNVVKREDVPKVLHNAAMHLAHGGLLIAKVWTRRTESRDLPEILKLYREKFSHEDFMHSMAVRLYTLCYDPNSGATPLLAVRKLLEEHHTLGMVTDTELQTCANIINEKTKLCLFFPLRKEWETLFSKDFEILQRYEPSPIGPDPVPIYVLRKK